MFFVLFHYFIVFIIVQLNTLFAILADEQPEAIQELPIHREKCIVWFRFMSKRHYRTVVFFKMRK